VGGNLHTGTGSLLEAAATADVKRSLGFDTGAIIGGHERFTAIWLITQIYFK
jgi:hypothetical protein